MSPVVSGNAGNAWFVFGFELYAGTIIVGLPTALLMLVGQLIAGSTEPARVHPKKIRFAEGNTDA